MARETVVDFIRHTDSVWTERARARVEAKEVPLLGGRQNELPLSTLGVEQAQVLGKYLTWQGLDDPDMVLGSPANRARQTFTEAYGPSHTSRLYVPMDYFQERDWGDLTLQPRAVLDQPPYLDQRQTLDSEFIPPNGESVSQVRDRMLAGLHYIIQVLGPGYYQVYGHQGSIKLLAGEYATTATTNGLTPEQVDAHTLALASITRLQMSAQEGIRLARFGTPTINP